LEEKSGRIEFRDILTSLGERKIDSLYIEGGSGALGSAFDSGIVNQEGRGIGLINKIKAYKLQEQGLDTEEANIALGFPPDMRDYGIGAQILSDLNVRKMRLMTNNPKKLVGLKGHGIEVVERVPLIMETNPYDEKYFKTKKEKMGHLF
jgi:3,4-dihydroxy 2-butanone 4-phosphate synthase/GTP cyclohydrolase II